MDTRQFIDENGTLINVTFRFERTPHMLDMYPEYVVAKMGVNILLGLVILLANCVTLVGE